MEAPASYSLLVQGSAGGSLQDSGCPGRSLGTRGLLVPRLLPGNARSWRLLPPIHYLPRARQAGACKTVGAQAGVWVPGARGLGFGCVEEVSGDTEVLQKQPGADSAGFVDHRQTAAGMGAAADQINPVEFLEAIVGPSMQHLA
ncbi:hypothetical protein SAMN06265222_12273 [Neorhodopirellula lusitana]|uniref:Uncharacterized protein n=1 Tax=Neorhodopirellula lusitana TaxID=445327 RepID=A0ABY1QPC9_9BACT|nr:hypothetical protein SAMN06265222_12273 [Neorhodopirellula lusitana]